MSKKNIEPTSEKLAKAIIESIQEHKGLDIVSLDLQEIETAVCDFFIICTGTSNTHIAALTNHIRKEVSKKLKEKPWHIEGENNCEWVLIDYLNVVVHIFSKEKRDFYRLEDLWADANVRYIEQTA